MNNLLELRLSMDNNFLQGGSKTIEGSGKGGRKGSAVQTISSHFNYFCRPIEMILFSLSVHLFTEFCDKSYQID